MTAKLALMSLRYRWSCQVLYSRYGEFYDLQQQKAAIAAKRGWVPASFWVALAGNLNDFFLEREYPNLQAFAVEQAAREQDYDFMKVMRESYRLCVQGSVKIELFQEAQAP